MSPANRWARWSVPFVVTLVVAVLLLAPPGAVSAPQDTAAILEAAPAASPTCQERVVNGGFESGLPPDPWVEFSDYELVYDAAGLAPIVPYQGQWAAWLGGVRQRLRRPQSDGDHAGGGHGHPLLLVPGQDLGRARHCL